MVDKDEIISTRVRVGGAGLVVGVGGGGGSFPVAAVGRLSE